MADAEGAEVAEGFMSEATIVLVVVLGFFSVFFGGLVALWWNAQKEKAPPKPKTRSKKKEKRDRAKAGAMFSAD